MSKKSKNKNQNFKNISVLLSFIFNFCFLTFNFSFAGTVDKIIVVVNGETITQAELDAAVESIAGMIKKESKDEGDFTKQLEARRKEILDRMIEEKLILSEAKRKNIKVQDAEVEEKLKEVESKFDSEEKFNEVLNEQDISLKDLKQRYADQIMVSELVDIEVRRKITITPSEVLQYYEAHKGDFKEPEQIRLKNILIKAGGEYKDEEALALAEKILGFIKAGENFDDLVLKYSKGPNADKGGDLGFVKRDQMLKQIEDVVFNLNVGECSGVIKTDVGYHIFKVEEKKPEGLKGLDAVRGEVEKTLYLTKAKQLYDQWVETLKKNAYISFR